MKEVLQYQLFSIGSQEINLLQILFVSATIIGLFYIYRLALKKFSPQFFQSTELTQEDKKSLFKLLRGLAILCFIFTSVVILQLDFMYQMPTGYKLSVLSIVRLLLFLQFSRLLYWLGTKIFIHGFYARKNRDDTTAVSKAYNKNESEASAFRILRNIFFVLVGIFALNNFNLNFNLYSKIIEGETVSFGFSTILQAFLILLLAQLIVWVVTQVFLFNIYKRNDIVVGSQYAINQLIKYVIYVIAILAALDVFGINMSILLGGAAALLVGVGLGLQQTFNDFVSGLVLLFERSVSVGDILEIDGVVGRVKIIGLRASTLETRGNISLVVPNHKLVNENVINWNHDTDKVRFDIDLGVAYGSDTTLVKKLLLKAVKDNPYVIDYPAPFVRFLHFGSSSLDFKLYFFTRNLMVIEDIKSDIRLEIDKLFRENNISIPFQQQEIRILK